MLFAIKRRALPALLLAAALAAVALLLGADLDTPHPTHWTPGAVCFAAILASDGGCHTALALIGRRAYLDRYRALAHYFCPQTPTAILAGGALAFSEELLLRGVLLESLRAPLGDPGAVALVALVFGAFHVIPGPLAVFGAWAVWEGALLGATYILTDSLLVTALVHAAHDIGGFTVFAVQRRTGWLL